MSRSVLRRRAAVVAAVGLVAVACTSKAGGDGSFQASASPGTSPGTSPGSSPGSPSGSPSASGSAACPASYAQPDPHRPRITLTFDLAADLASVHGTEDVTFTPDLPVRELVFRLTANTPPTVRQGNRIEITAARSDPGGGAYRFRTAGAAAGTQGGLLVLPLGRQVPAGQPVTAHVKFTLTLGTRAFDRFGHSGQYAWWGSGQPLLAWERGVGWHEEPLLQYTAESATSEAARTELTVTAPGKYTVLSTGTQDAPRDDGESGRKRWHAVADRARDVSVVVGPFRTARATVAGTTVQVGTAPDKAPQRLLTEAETGVRELVARLGPPPFGSINLARLPISGGGIEYPGAIMLLDDSRVVTVHELAHQWFYAMVGNSQARDPWLDEAFATFVEEEIDGTTAVTAGALKLPGKVGDSTTHYGRNGQAYYNTTYGKGAAALIAARDAGPPDKFDAALRCYVNANAWRIAKPADLAAALAGLPAATKVLQDAGALPR